MPAGFAVECDRKVSERSVTPEFLSPATRSSMLVMMEVLVQFFTAVLDLLAAVKAFFADLSHPVEGIWTFEALFVLVLLIAAVCGIIAFGSRQRRRRQTVPPGGNSAAD